MFRLLARAYVWKCMPMKDMSAVCDRNLWNHAAAAATAAFYMCHSYELKRRQEIHDKSYFDSCLTVLVC